MIRDEEFWAGHIESSIGELLAERPEFWQVFSAVLITTLDSSSDLKRDKMVLEFAIKPRFLGNGAVYEGRTLPELARKGFFSGFDEIWCYVGKASMPKPDHIRFVGPYSPANSLEIGLKSWMRDSSCILGLGDGVGLNYVTTEERLARLLEDHGE